MAPIQVRIRSCSPRKLCLSSEQLDRQVFNSNAVVAAPGLYQLEWDTPTVAPCLNPRHPRLSVYTDSSGYSDAVAVIQLFCVFFGRYRLCTNGPCGYGRRTPLPLDAPLQHECFRSWFCAMLYRLLNTRRSCRFTVHPIGVYLVELFYGF